jgi:Arc/MetJ-type ribon-helix-helix transcriptional regulator
MNAKTITLRLPDDLLARLDQWAQAWVQVEPGRRCSRSDAVRLLLERGLATKEVR